MIVGFSSEFALGSVGRDDKLLSLKTRLSSDPFCVRLVQIS